MSAPVFNDYNGLVQLRLERPEDLEVIHALEPARWSATSAPIEQFHCDPRLLQLMDTDENGRIRVHELRAAHRWIQARLGAPERLAARDDTVRLADLTPGRPETTGLRGLVELMLRELGRTVQADAAVTLAEIRRFRDSFAREYPNGDGTVVAPQVEDPELRALVQDIVAGTGGAPDLSGEAGVGLSQLDTWLARAAALITWEAEGRLDDAQIHPLGPDTAAAAAALEALGPKLDQYFAQCDLLALDRIAEARLAASPEALAALDVSSPARIRDWLEAATIARPTAEAVLRLDQELNPHYREALARLSREVLPPLLGRDGPVNTLSAAELSAARARLAPFVTWRDRRPAGLPAGATGEAMAALLAGPLPGRLRALIAGDNEASDELMQVGDLERFALYQRWLLELANNMVSFPSLFAHDRRALFQAGTLVLDGREMSFCVRVYDKAAHKLVAQQSYLFLVYAQLERRAGGQTFTQLVGAAVTSGVRGSIGLGKRGVFYDRDGVEWDALIVDLIDQPISLWEAAIAPFVRLKAFISERVQSLVGSKAAASEASLTASADAGVSGAAKGKHADSGGNMTGLLVGGSVAVAALGSSMAFIVGTVKGLFTLQGLVAVVFVLGTLMSLSALLAWFRLRKRDLGTVLEACGWAFNLRLKLRRGHSYRFTRVPRLPEGSVRDRKPIDLPSFEEDAGGRRFAVWLVLLALLFGGLLYLFRAHLAEAWRAGMAPDPPVEKGGP